MVEWQQCLVRYFRIIPSSENRSWSHPWRNQKRRNPHTVAFEVEVRIGIGVRLNRVSWWHQVIVSTAVLVEGDDKKRVGPYLRVARKGVKDVLYEAFTGIKTLGRM